MTPAAVTPDQQIKLRKSIEDPVMFCRDWLQFDAWSIQERILRSLDKPKSRTAVKACHSSGKTALSARAVLWFLARYQDCIVVTTAPCYDDQTEILTDKGWKLFSDLTISDQVAQVYEDGKLEMVEPLERLKFKFDGELIGYKSTIVDFLVTPNHRCLVDMSFARKEFQGEIKRAEEIYGKNCVMRRQVSWEGKDTATSPEWAEFLGYWFAEGWAEFNPESRQYRIILTSKNDCQYARYLLNQNNLEFHEYERDDNAAHDFAIYDKDLASYFLQVHPGATRTTSCKSLRVPAFIKEATKDVIGAFLRGYWVGDGNTDENGSERLFTASRELAGDLQELYLKIGVVANVTKKDNTKYYEQGTRFSPNPSYVVSASKSKGSFPQLKAPTPAVKSGWYKQPYQGNVYCVHVPTGLVLVRRNGKTLVCGQTWIQIEKALWGELHVACSKSKYPFPVPFKTQLQMGPKRYAMGLSTSVTEGNEGVRFQGFHAEHVLIVMDEAPGVDPKLWEAIEGIRAGGDVRILAIGNPTIASGPFYDAFAGARGSGWSLHTISAFDTPNFDGLYIKYVDQDGQEVSLGDLNGRDLLDKDLTEEDLLRDQRPYLTTRKWVKEKFYEWGPGSFLWDSRVLGAFPSQSEDALISFKWLEAARNSPRETGGKCHVGIDVAGPGEDETVLTIRRGPRIVLQKCWVRADIEGEIISILRDYKPFASINVDCVGVGWGMYTKLAEIYKDIVRPVNVGESPEDGEKFADLKAELYWNLRLRFQQGEISGLDDELTVNQLASVRYRHNLQGKVQIESKKDAGKRGVRSPDRAESIMLAFAEVNRMLLGAIEYMRDEVEAMKHPVSKIATSSMIKPDVGEQTTRCDACGSVALARFGGTVKCSQCGKVLVERESEFQAPKRSDYLAKVGR